MTRLKVLDASPAPRTPSRPSRVALISLTTFCNAYCSFCCVLDILNQPALNPTDDAIYEAIRKARTDGCKTLSFTGGEPTVHPKFTEFCRFGRELGYEAITINTNGIQFKSAAFARKAVESGLTHVDVSIHGHTAELHDRLVGRAGAFDALVKGVRHLVALQQEFGLVLGATTVVASTNGPFLKDITTVLLDLGFRALRFKHCFEGATGSDKQQVSSYAPIVEPLREAVRIAHAQHAGVQLTHFPLCLLGEEAIFCTDFNNESVLSISHKGEAIDLGRVSLHRRTDTRPCEQCLLSSVCTKVDEHYEAAHGTTGFRSISTPALLKDFLDAGIHRYQVGENLRKPLDLLAESYGAPPLYRANATVWLRGSCGRSCTVCDCNQEASTADHDGVPNLVTQRRGGQLFLRGEALRDPALEKVLQKARPPQWQAVWIRSHGEDLVHQEHAHALVQKNISGVWFPLFATRSIVHDRLAERPGALVTTLRAMRAVAAEGLHIGVEIPLISLKFSSPESVLELALRAVTKLHSVRLYLPKRTPSPIMVAQDWTTMETTLQRTFLLAQEHGISWSWQAQDGIPLCALPRASGVKHFTQATAPVSSKTFAHTGPCLACGASSLCPGPSDVYLSSHGTAGLHPIEATAVNSPRSP